MAAGLTDKYLVTTRTGFSGNQRIYRFPSGYGLSAVDGPVLHSYPFAWEIAVLRDVSENGGKFEITYDTPLTSDVEVFDTVDEANAFIERAIQEIGGPSPTPAA